MDWTEIKITVDTKDIDTAGDIANMVVPYGIYIEDYSDLEREAMEIAHIDLIDEDLLAKDRTKGIVHIYIDPQDHPQEAAAFLTERLAAAGIENEIDLTQCKNADWENNWKQYFHPIKIGERLLIRPTWEDEYDAEGRAVLHLEPGLAFGTGSHETTRLCLEALEKNIKGGERVLDVGCGSGILAIASLLLVSFDHLLDHLSADRTGLTGGQIAVVALLEVDADLAGGFHLELVHSGLGLGDVELVAVLAGHNDFLLFL